MARTTAEPGGHLNVRLARPDDIPVLQALIERSARALSAGFYTEAETESAIRHVFGVDSRLIADGTYFAVDDGQEIVGCGGWSRRKTLYGGDQRPSGGGDALLDPATGPARIRAFFVAPDRARQGIGRRILEACFQAAAGEGFIGLELMATLPGVPLYAACGFREVERVTDILPDGTPLRFVRMRRALPIDAGDVRLRVVELDDAETVAQLMSPAISQWVLSWPERLTVAQARDRIATVRAEARRGDALYFVIERREDSLVVGWISVIRWHDDPKRGAIGYWIGERYQGNGYMTAAAIAAVTTGFERLGLDVVEAGANPSNDRSFAIMRRLGMKLAGERTLWSASRACHEQCMFYEVSRQEFDAAVRRKVSDS